MDDDRFLKVSLAILLLFLAGFVFKITRSILFPFVLAVFVSYVIDPIVGFLIKFKIPKPVAIGLVLLGSFVFLYLIGLAVYSSGKSFADALPKYQDQLTALSKSLNRGIAGIPIKLRVESYLEKIEISTITSLILTGLGPIVELFSKLFVLFLFLVFIMAGRGRVLGKVRNALSPEHASQVTDVLAKINRQVRKYLVIKTLMGIADGIIVWLVLKAFGVDFALVFGFLAFLLNYIPSIGSLIAMALRVAFTFFQFGSVWVALGVLLITGGADMAMGNLIEPRIMGKGLGMSPLVVLFSLIFWSWLWGVPGMIIAVPVAATIKIICQNIEALKPVAILMS